MNPLIPTDFKTIRQSKGPSYNYYGFAAPGSPEESPVWLIMREDVNTGRVDYPSGTPRYDQKWTEVETLTYA